MKTLIFSAIAAITLLISACNSNSISGNNKPSDSGSLKTADITYTCPMHPEVVSNKPGKCPKCKMELVQKENEDTADHSGHQH